MAPTPYRIHKIVRRTHGKPGITKPDACTLHGFLKYDGPESLHCVYNEYVALRLAHALRVPVAEGVLAVAGDGLAYASLEVGLPGVKLPDMQERQAGRVASLYPSDVAALVVFDIWIGNWDRGGNIKAAVVSEHLPLFLAFDHSHALLNVDETAGGSIARLGGGSLIVESHPFYGRATPDMLDKWVERIARMDAGTVAECCGFGRPFRSVGTETQEALGIALAARAGDLPRIVSENKAKIQVQGHHGNR